MNSVKLNQTDVLCWYPSSGKDFKAMNNWLNGKGNNIIPNIFIYTDDNYVVEIDKGLVSFGESNLFDAIDGDFTVEYYTGLDLYHFADEGDFTLYETPVIDNQYCQISANEYLTSMRCYAYLGQNLARQPRFNNQQLWIDGCVDLSGNNNVHLGPLAGISGCLNVDDLTWHNSQSQDVLNELLANSISPTECINCLYYKKNIACLSTAGVKIIIVPSRNNDFYDYLRRTSKKIHAFFEKRSWDNFDYIDSLTRIGVEEAMAYQDEVPAFCVNYDRVGESFIAASTEFTWDLVTLFRKGQFKI